jgi:hypothetical protein
MRRGASGQQIPDKGFLPSANSGMTAKTMKKQTMTITTLRQKLKANQILIFTIPSGMPLSTKFLMPTLKSVP